MTLKRTGVGKGVAFYESESGEKYQIRQVNRSYEGRKKPPVFYLEAVREGKPCYMSGLFQTQHEGLYSMDLRDKVTGMKVLYDAVFKQGGAVLEIRAKGKTKAGAV